MSQSNLPNPTPQGQAIIEAWNTQPEYSIMVNALAGCGKTTFLQQLAPHVKQRSVLGLAFNKKNAEDLAAKLPSHWTLATMNSIGHRALGKALQKRLNVDTGKTNDLIKAVARDWGIGKLGEEEYNDISTLVRQAKSQGLMPSSLPYKTLLPDNEASWEAICDQQMIDMNGDKIRFVREVLYRGVRLGLAGTIDYDDQIYMSVLCNGAFEKYEVVMVDEAQDLSPMNHIQLQKSLAFGGRFVVVGDPRQAIYAFRGASSKSMGEIQALKPGKFLEFPLSLTFRCPRVVVERNQAHAVGFEAAPTNKDGDFVNLKFKEWDLDTIRDLRPNQRIAILCRNNAPLLSAAFRIIRSGEGVTMLGRDIGKNLVKLTEKIMGRSRDIGKTPISEVIQKIKEWKAKEIDIAMVNGKEEMLAPIEDRAESLLACAEGSGAKTLDEMLKAMVALFEDQRGLITLGTGHRAKGMEWPVVVHLDPWRIPSKHAKTAQEAGNPIPMEQELNLKYVLETRSQDLLVNADLKDFVS
jgi:DNA helicase-2/ATP-dependent DNA helicase PcrA